MSNSYFRFKQFSIVQSHCAMKVGTDAVLLGAYASLGVVCQGLSVLDVGLGTGVISLMLAQRYPSATVDGVEIDHGAYLQAQENIQSSPFSDRVKAYHTDFLAFDAAKHYDLIVSNPPYFEQGVKANSQTRTLARHTDSLSFEDLLVKSLSLLSPKGRIVLILPSTTQAQIQALADQLSLVLVDQLHIRGNASQPVKRIIYTLERRDAELVQEQQEHHLTIEEARHCYTADYIALTRAFYLKM